MRDCAVSYEGFFPHYIKITYCPPFLTAAYYAPMSICVDAKEQRKEVNPNVAA